MAQLKIESIKQLLGRKFSLISSKKTTFAGHKAQKAIFGAMDREWENIVVPISNYTVTIDYIHGAEDKSKKAINKMFNSIEINAQDMDFSQQTEYTHEDPYFSLKTSSDWGLLPLQSRVNVLMGLSKKFPLIDMNIFVEKLSPNVQNSSRKEYMNYIKNNNIAKENNHSMFGLETHLYDKDIHYQINPELNDAISYKYKFKDENSGETKTFFAGYRILDGDRVIAITLNYYGESQEKFQTRVENFEEQVLSNLTLGREVKEPQPTTTPEGTTTPPEKEEKTQPKPPQQPQEQVKNKVKKLKKENEQSRKMMGKIALKVESGGEAWYFSPQSEKAHYLGRPGDAFQVMREQGVGISNQDLKKIPVGVMDQTEKRDSDDDGLSDALEKTLGTDPDNPDTDNDGYTDGVEVKNNYNPRGEGKTNRDKNFSRKQKGKILLQTEDKGQAWYVNPEDGKRYFLGKPADAFQVMRKAGLGISDQNFQQITDDDS